MGFNTHVFISYSHADNLEAGSAGWVTRFHELLEPLLTSRLKRTKAVIWRDKRLSDNDVFDPVIMKQLPDTAVFVAVLTDNYVESEWCRREAQAFCDLAAANLGLAPADKQRVFKVVKLPPERLDPLPAPMRNTLATPFYVRVDKDRRETQDDQDTPLELDPDFGPEYASRLKKQVALLAQDIAVTLKVIGAPGTTAPAADPAAAALAPAAPDPAAAAKPTVYLAQCGEDRRADRDALRGALVQGGYAVLPDRELPADEAGYRAEVARMLERSALSVHLLGTSPGWVPDGPGMDSELVIQNELALQRSLAAPLQRVVSLPAGTVCSRPIHQKFLEAMLSDIAVLGKAELIDGGYQKVLKAVQDALEAIERPPPAPAPAAAPQPGAAAAQPKLYVIYDRPDMAATGDLRDALEEHFKVLKPVFDGTPEQTREAARQRLTDCDAVLVYYGSGTDGWMDSILSEVEQAAAWRGGTPLRAVFQWIAAPATDDKRDKLRKPRPNIINALEGCTPALLEPIVKAVRGE